MTRRRLAGLAVGFVLLAAVLAVGVAGTSDANARRVYLLAIVGLYSIAVVVWVLFAILVKVLPNAVGEIERHLAPVVSEATIPQEVSDLLVAIRKGRRSHRDYELHLKPLLDSLDPDTSQTPGGSVGQVSRNIARLRRGPSANKLAAMLDRIEER